MAEAPGIFVAITRALIWVIACAWDSCHAASPITIAIPKTTMRGKLMMTVLFIGLLTEAQAWLVAKYAAVLAFCCGKRQAGLPMFLFPKLANTTIDRNLITLSYIHLMSVTGL